MAQSNGLESRNDSAVIHQTGESTSSIGPQWPPEASSHRRMKGIYTPSVIDTDDQFKDDFFSVYDRLRQSGEFGSEGEKGFSRISLRAVVNNDLLFNMDPPYRDAVEAVIPLAGTQPDFTNYSMVYFGENHPSRQSDNHLLTENLNNLGQVITKMPLEPSVLIGRPQPEYQIEVLETGPAIQPDNPIVEQIFNLIRRFNYSMEDTLKMLQSQNNTFGVAVFQGQIVGVGLAEVNQIPVGSNLLTIAELTEASTDKNHLGKGLYSAISTLLLQNLAEKSLAQGFAGRELDLAYGEANGSSIGVLATAQRQGRTFSTTASAEFGFPDRGFLPLHVPILDPHEEVSAESQIGRNNNLFPAYLNRDTLYNLYLHHDNQ